MNSQSTEAATSKSSSSTTDRGGPGPSGRRRPRSLVNTTQNTNKEELDDGISKKKPKPKLPMELAFENDVVLLEVFRHSSPSDLKEFRLVNRRWNDTAASTLLIRKSLELKLREVEEQGRRSHEFTSDPIASLSSQDKFANGSLGSMTDLCRLIESSAKFPTKSLTFRHTYAKSHPQVRQLLKVFGNQVKELTFECRCKVAISFLRELLVDLVPNLEILILRGSTLVEKQPLSTTDPEGDNDFQCDRIHSLPHLTQLVFLPVTIDFAKPNSDYPLHVELFQELVDAALNLHSVYTFPLEFVDVLLAAGKLQLVKKLALEPTCEVEKRLGGTVEVHSGAIYQKLASMKPEINTLEIRCLSLENGVRSRQFELLEKSMFESAVNSVLESSKNSLRILDIQMKPGFSIDLPVLPNLKKLKADLEPKAHFSAGLASQDPTFSFQRNFPRLHELHLWLYSYMDVHLKDVFCGQLEKWMSPTVKHLQLGGELSYQFQGEIDSPYEGPQTLGKMFPNTKSVVIVYDVPLYNQENLNSLIWHQIPADVESISLGQFAVKEQFEDSFVRIQQDIAVQRIIQNLLEKEQFQDVMDSFFTGIPIKICRRLRKLPLRICEEKKGLDALRSEPSICVFKNLKELNICCNDFRSPHPFASHVTGLYAFDLMPQLKVTVTYKPEEGLDGSRKNITPSEDMNRSLKNIAPYITQVCHEKSYKY